MTSKEAHIKTLKVLGLIALLGTFLSVFAVQFPNAFIMTMLTLIIVGVVAGFYNIIYNEIKRTNHYDV